MTLKLQYPLNKTPQLGQPMLVAPGIYWLRMPLPMALDHINLWLLADGDGWTVVDTGISLPDTVQLWEQVLAQYLDDLPIKRVIVTHLHPDHIGLAGWLVEKTGAEFCMSETEYTMSCKLRADTGQAAPQNAVDFYTAAGFSESDLERFRRMYGRFGKMVSPIPESFTCIKDGETLTIGDYDWELITGSGHSPEHICLFNRALQLFISGDQLLPRISSVITVWPTDPGSNPLKNWLESCHKLGKFLPENVLVLPSHGEPFRGAHRRLESLITGHEQNLEKLYVACGSPQRAIDVFGALFKGKIDEGNYMMACGESIAHLNYLMNLNKISGKLDESGVRWYRQI